MPPSTIQQSDHPILKVAPAYPERAQEDRLEGWAVIRIYVDEQGRITDTEVVDSSDSIFEDLSDRAAWQFVFEPQIEDGVPVARTYDNLFRFRLEDEPELTSRSHSR